MKLHWVVALALASAVPAEGRQEIPDYVVDATPPIAWENILSTGTEVFAGMPNTPFDAVSAAIRLDFPFPFFDGVYGTVRISSNGNLQLTGAGSALANNTDLPSTAITDALICPLWDDLVKTSVGWVRWCKVGGVDPHFVVTWSGVLHNATSTGTPIGNQNQMQVLLYPSGRIVFNYLTVSGSSAGQYATIGIQSEGATKAQVYCYNFSTTQVDNDGYGTNVATNRSIHWFKSAFPQEPTTLEQAAGAGAIAEPPGYVTDATIYFRAQVSDPEGDPVRLEAQYLRSGKDWDEAATLTSTLVPSGSTAGVLQTFTAYDDGDYAWRARTVDCWGKPSTWIDFAPEPAHFRVDLVNPAAVLLIAPGNGQDVGVTAPDYAIITIDWTTSTDVNPDKYEYEIHVESEFLPENIIASGVVVPTAADVELPLSMKPYYWRVRAIDKAGNVGPWSVPFQFRLVFDDGMSHAMGDAARVCGFGAPQAMNGTLLLLAIALSVPVLVTGYWKR